MNPWDRISCKPMMENINPMITGFQLKLSNVNCEKIAWNDPFGIHSRKAETNSLLRFFMDRRFASCEKGFSLTKEIAFSLYFSPDSPA